MFYNFLRSGSMAAFAGISFFAATESVALGDKRFDNIDYLTINNLSTNVEIATHPKSQGSQTTFQCPDEHSATFADQLQFQNNAGHLVVNNPSANSSQFTTSHGSTCTVFHGNIIVAGNAQIIGMGNHNVTINGQSVVFSGPSTERILPTLKVKLPDSVQLTLNPSGGQWTLNNTTKPLTAHLQGTGALKRRVS